MNIFPDDPSGDENSGLEDYPFDLGIVPITFDDTVVVHIFSSIEIPEVDRINLTLNALLEGINFRKQTEIDKLIKRVGIKVIDNVTRDKSTRGPYYGYDQLISKLAGMKAAINYIEEISVIQGEADDDDENDVYFVTIGDG